MAQFTKYTGTVTGSAGTLITALDAALVTGQSWTTPQTGVNKKAYQAPSGSQRLYRIDDSGPGAGGALEARLSGYGAMTDVDTGTDPFPTAAQGLGGTFAGICIRKSTGAGTARNYKIWADARTCIGFIDAEGTAAYRAFYFGEFFSFVTADTWNACTCARSSENSAASGPERLALVQAQISTAGSGFFVARGYNGLGTSVLMNRVSDGPKMNAVTNFAGGITYPNPADGGLYCARVWLSDNVTGGNSGPRGRIRGLWVPLHPAASVGFNDGTTFSGTGALAGYTFEMVKSVFDSGPTAGCALIETSNTLETN